MKFGYNLAMKTLIDYKNIRKIGLVARLGADLSGDILVLKKIFDKRGIELLLEIECAKSVNLSLQNAENSQNLPQNLQISSSAAQNSRPKTKNSQNLSTQTPHFKGFSLDELFANSDFIISLGGDGTLISLCRKASKHQKALLGIHAGHLGFLTDFTAAGASAFFDEFFAGKFRVEEPFLLDIILQSKDGRVFEKTAFNDVVFSRTQKQSMAYIQVLRGGKVFNEYHGDGLIVASAAGSTAYNLSANGPIIYTLAEVFLLTPVCSHSLTQRPIVLPKGFELEVRAAECSFFIDGQECLDTRDFASIKLRLGEKKVRLIHPKNRDYFQILKEKLRWGN